MPFPKFTSGRSGRLTFDTLNELFQRVEALEGTSERKPWSINAPEAAFFAKVGTQNPNFSDQYSFTEVCRKFNVAAAPLDPAAWTAVTGGRSSAGPVAGGVSSYVYPLKGTGLQAGSVYPVVATVDDRGYLIYVPISAPAVGNAFPAFIAATAVLVSNFRWQYTCRRVSVNSAGNGWDIPTSGPTFTALNGAEAQASDTPPIYGVGMQPPASATLQMIRQPIRIGTIVTMTFDADRYSFSMPNGYKVIC